MSIAQTLPSVTRGWLWRAGRKLYLFARGEQENDPHINGEYWLLAQVLSSAGRPVVLFDVGANRGDWSAEALRLNAGAQQTQIFAFEPCAESRALLQQRVAATPQVVVQPFALSDHGGEAPFFSGGAGIGTNSLAPASGEEVEQVSLRTIDQFVADHSLRRVTMIKIDTEGFDWFVLKGAEQLLRDGRVDLVQFEYNWRWLLNHVCLRDVFGLLRTLPYRFGKLMRKQIEFYESWHFELERFFETNCVLVKRGTPWERLGIAYRFNASNIPVPVP